MNPVQWLCLPTLLPAWTGRAESSKGDAGEGNLLRWEKGKKINETRKLVVLPV